jgi:hypothetical protein
VAVRLRGGLVALGVVVLGACGGASAQVRPETPAAAPAAVTVPATPVVDPAPGAPRRLAPEQQAALAHLAGASGPLEAAPEDHHEHGAFAPDVAVAMTEAEHDALAQQWAQAEAAAARLSTQEAATAEGYVQASSQLPGIGAHWVKWSLIDQPFDASQPSMILFDQSSLHPPRLAGLSYWVRSPEAPAGFAGTNDHWHQHSGLCFVNGWLAREGVPSADLCPGQWLNGSDLWMLHAWVVPTSPNRFGPFAARNPALCPPTRQQLPDLLKCPDTPPATPAQAAASPGLADPLYCPLREDQSTD